MPKVSRSKVRARIKQRKREERARREIRFPTARRAFVELSEDYKWIEVWFPYSFSIKEEVAKIDNAHFKDRYQGGPKWRVPRDLQTCDKLREIFGPTEFWENPETGNTTHISGLWIGDALRSWARQQRSLEENLGNLTKAKDAKLSLITPESRIGRAIAGEPIPELELPPLPNGKPHPLMTEREARPYQRADIKIMTIANVMNCNQPGCLTGDAEIEVNRAGRSFKIRLDTLVDKFNGEVTYVGRYGATPKSWDLSIPTKVRARFDDGSIRLVQIDSAVRSGKQKVFVLETDSGRKLRATAEHPILTSKGWVEMANLRRGDLVVVAGKQGIGKEANKPDYLYVSVRHHSSGNPYGRKPGGHPYETQRGKVLVSRLVVEAKMNGMSYDRYLTGLRDGKLRGLKFLSPTQIVHHKDEDRLNNDISNLEVVDSQPDHARMHSRKTRWNRVYSTSLESVRWLKSGKIEETFDISLAEDPHNYLANGFVVHNTGKTIETIGSWVESGALDEGPILVVGPVKSLENTWLKEILRWLGDRDDVVIYTDENPLYRRHQVEDFLDAYEKDEFEGPAILCVNFDWLRLLMTHKKGSPILTSIERLIGMRLRSEPVREDDSAEQVKEKQFTFQDNLNAALKAHDIERDPAWDIEGCLNALADPYFARKDYKGNHYAYSNDLQRRLLAVEWSAVVIDEFHKSGMNNRLTLFYQGVELLSATLKSALSGTPMGGKPRKLWPILHWIEPEEYTAEWAWIKRWLETESGRSAHSKIVKAIKKGKEEEFGKAHARHLIRRTKLAVLPGLPPRVEQVVWSKMSAAQEKQYKDFSRTLEIKIEEERLSANNVLTEYLRLKQFANAKQRLVDGVPYPTEDCGKLEDLWEKLNENGVRPLSEDPEPGARAIVASESSRMVYMVTAWLNKKGVAADAMTGETDSKPLMKRFKEGSEEPYVIVMTTTMGVSLDMEEAQSAHALDETWNPDDVEQFFDRGDRGTRVTALNCYIYRSYDTIQQYIGEVNEGKAVTNKTVLDIRRRIHEAEELD